ncbi:TetR family transcriptional regulator [Paenibacillus rhizosphaerae]|uniref:TetR family transcriptional regulator n=1 Tax=Paenibacillus rhizosphaerae TaxID=297318 RepID=A0A1R1ERH3_9BACL|nr:MULTISPECIES: TetR/AcrR family transcriptional regulator [Paenibacillus]MEC0178096.1 TetR/AcrR family transcriptional regulator [Paenibacillus favisporus]OMF54440.1 TetR family transcriptional regulator [Paenibacillus rhizosphaerae]PQP91186.1 TetR/AcrR family transcriptional regulator [Paenibacillus sp. AR247]
MNQKQLQSEQTKRKIADAARALFVQKGYKATSIEDIVAATGSSKGNIYYHFKSKEGLFLHLLEEWDREWELNWEQNEHLYKTTTDKLYAVAEQLAADDLNHPLTKAADEFFHNEEKTSEVESRMAEMKVKHLAFNQNLLQEGIDRGEFMPGDAERLAAVLEAIFFGANQLSRRLNPEKTTLLYRDAVTVFLNGVATDKQAKER